MSFFLFPSKTAKEGKNKLICQSYTVHTMCSEIWRSEFHYGHCCQRCVCRNQLQNKTSTLRILIIRTAGAESSFQSFLSLLLFWCCSLFPCLLFKFSFFFLLFFVCMICVCVFLSLFRGGGGGLLLLNVNRFKVLISVSHERHFHTYTATDKMHSGYTHLPLSQSSKCCTW